MRSRFFGQSDIGLHRQHNEDSFLADPDLGIYIVADGVGGRAKGEVASKETVELIWEWIKRDQQFLTAASHSANPATIGQLSRLMRGAIQNACYLVHSMGELDPEQRGMSTTASAFLICGAIGIVGQVGDSRVYLARSGLISQLTEDHTLVNYQLKHGLITAEEAASSRSKNVITRAVGHKDYVDVDVLPVPLFPSDRLLLCSDGLHGYVESGADLQYLLDLDVQAAVQEAIAFANAKGGKDNVTAMVVELLE